ncbi:MAG: hypothetical protein IJZ55_10335 [Lachnospiraceae bacterium]|nr:hypothetical protein [Lachnospiraceae bacterium]
MKKYIVNILLLMGTLVPLILLFWPFISWGDAMSIILRIIPSICAQMLFCRVAKHRGGQAIPFLLTAAFAILMTDAYISSPAWNKASFWVAYVGEGMSPFLCCLVVYLTSVFLKERKEKHGCIEENNKGQS